MSESTGTGRHTTDTDSGARKGTGAGTAPPVTGRASTGTRVGHESYSFACLRCGHGWEQSYEIEHRVDARGAEVVVYRAEGREVPSPLSRPTCGHCEGHVVRIMRPGRVSTVLESMQARRPGGSTRAPRDTGAAGGGATDEGAQQGGAGRPGRAGRDLWHASHLLRTLHLARRAR
ncbi:hypothetical protein [Streptomyces odontomachi]|uniref:hypothetical protein n=1 Tax=Streptomyces odontomachi TaxID=2944940 RepID=UPI00210EB699|nr:hypothetical protein [Streptomyces sp. ODS25]